MQFDNSQNLELCMFNQSERYCKRPKDCPLVEIGVDIGDKDECVITWKRYGE